MTNPTSLSAARALAEGNPAAADRLLSALETNAFRNRDVDSLSRIWPDLSATRRQRRARAASGRIDLHTHTTASDGEMTVEQLLCQHFVRGQILINDHNIIDSLPAARRLIAERDLELDVFLGIEVICTRERRAFEFQAIAPTHSEEFVALCLEHRQNWKRACELFVAEFARRPDMFAQPLWQQIAQDHSVGGSFAPVVERVWNCPQADYGRSGSVPSLSAEQSDFRHGKPVADLGVGAPGRSADAQSSFIWIDALLCNECLSQ